MLTLSPLTPNTKLGSNQEEMMDITSFSVFDHFDFDTIDFDDLIHEGGEVLPDLEMDSTDFMAEFAGDLFEDEDSDSGNQVVPGCGGDGSKNSDSETSKEDESEKSSSSSTRPEKEKEKEKEKKHSSSQAKKNNSNNNKSNEGKRKTKVDWTPDLHRRFVQAVEQLGVDKAVPSRILELMGIDCLTRHNVASHLQKYRSHRKHLLAREAEAASWSQKRHMYGIAVGKSKVDHTWPPPTIGFPPMTSPPIHHPNHHPFRPLHVWGHPTHHVEPAQTNMQALWPKQQLVVPCPSPTWLSSPPLDPSLSQHHHQHRFATAPPVAGIPPPHVAMYKPQQSAHSPPNHPPLDLHPTKESIDAAIGDVLSKPWLPLPIGLKPPSMGSVMVELQRQGVPKIPPSCS